MQLSATNWGGTWMRRAAAAEDYVARHPRRASYPVLPGMNRRRNFSPLTLGAVDWSGTGLGDIDWGGIFSDITGAVKTAQQANAAKQLAAAQAAQAQAAAAQAAAAKAAEAAKAAKASEAAKQLTQIAKGGGTIFGLPSPVVYVSAAALAGVGVMAFLRKRRK